MKGQTHGGKGSTPRPTNKRRFDENYEKIFNKTPSEGESQLDEGVHTPETNGRSGESKLREHVEGARVQGQADQEQTVEPVAWIYEKPLADGFSEKTLSFGYEPEFEGEVTPLYAHLPKRLPLSDEDVVDIARRNCGINFQYNDEIDAAIILAHEIEKAHGIGKENELQTRSINKCL